MQVSANLHLQIKNYPATKLQHFIDTNRPTEIVEIITL